MNLHAASGARAAVLSGIGSWLPEKVVTNEHLALTLDTSDEWIRNRIGVRQRRQAGTQESAADLAVQAGRIALESSGSLRADMVIVTTSTPDRPLPAMAPDVAHRLGLGGVGAFDLSAACSGFIYGLSVAVGQIASGAADRVLLITTEVLSSIIDPTDRSTAPIFGDGAAAVVLRAGNPDEPGAIGPIILGSDGTGKDLICIPGNKVRPGDFDSRTQRDHFVQMEGPQVYKQAVSRMAETSEKALAAAGWRIDEVDRFAAHQANIRILRAVGDRLGLAAERVLCNIEHVGNTSSASVPILLSESARDQRLEAGDKVLIAAFGGGITWGSATLTWPSLPDR